MSLQQEVRITMWKVGILSVAKRFELSHSVVTSDGWIEKRKSITPNNGCVRTPQPELFPQPNQHTLSKLNAADSCAITCLYPLTMTAPRCRIAIRFMHFMQR